MGLFTKSLLIILVAVSIPLLYKQFADDSTVKFMSQYYSNYKLIDQFLRKSAGHLDEARNFLPKPEQLKGVMEQVRKQVDDLVKSATSKSTHAGETKENYRVVSCASENLSGKEIRLWSKKELAEYDGSSSRGDILLAFLGLVYNVTINSQHYGQGAEYNTFAGRDATRAFITGNFTHDLTDDLKDIDLELYSQLEGWVSFYQSSYPLVGRLEGRYYDSQGCKTQELDRVGHVFEQLRQRKVEEQKQEIKFPECNSEWNGDLKQGRVWCSTKSGGIDREWVGVPRIYSENNVQRCVCLNLDSPDAGSYSKSMSVYPGCEPSATDCPIKHS